MTRVEGMSALAVVAGGAAVRSNKVEMASVALNRVRTAFLFPVKVRRSLREAPESCPSSRPLPSAEHDS